MSLPARVVAPLAAAAACLSCQALFGIDEDDPPSSAGTLGSAGSGGDGASSDAGAGAASGAGADTAECTWCAPTLPAGWVGPSYLYTTTATEPFTCPNLAVATTYWEGVPAAAFECTACGCEPPMGINCGQSLLTCYSDKCNGVVVYSGTPDSCGYTSQFAACSVGGSPIIGGSCAPSGGAVNLATWQLGHHLCKATPVDEPCEDGGCLGGPGDPAPSKVCVVSEAEGHVACPAGWEEPLQAWSSANDTRVCGCTCGAPQGTCTGGGYKLGVVPFSCDLSEVTGPGSCVPLGGNDTYANYAGPTGVNGSCAPSGPVPDGEFIPTGPRTICCRSWP